jgi:hypothetical protein
MTIVPMPIIRAEEACQADYVAHHCGETETKQDNRRSCPDTYRGLFAMTIHNEVLVEVPLPDGRTGAVLETDAFEDLLDTFRISSDGHLVRRVHALAEVSGVRKGPMDFFEGNRAVFVREEGLAGFSGFMNLFETRDREPRYFTARIDRGRLIGIRAGREDAWARLDAAGDRGDAFAALMRVREMLAVPAPDVAAIQAFVDDVVDGSAG